MEAEMEAEAEAQAEAEAAVEAETEVEAQVEAEAVEAEAEAQAEAEAVGPPSLAAPSPPDKESEVLAPAGGALQQKWRQGQGSAKDRAERRAARRE